MRTLQAHLVVTTFLTLVGCTGVEKPLDTGTLTDIDGDGYFAADDCDDENADIHPDADELCDSIDNDCDQSIDESSATDAPTWYADADADGFGDDNNAQASCEQPVGFVGTAGDCNDADATFYPGAPETDCADANDYNCDGSVQYADADGDGFAACEDCDDAEATTNDDGEESCDGVDNDCDGEIDNDAADATTFYQDADGDGFGDVNSPTADCEQPEGHVSDATDCYDQDDDVFPGASETCNGEDDDCDSDIDENDAADAQTWYADTDGDGHGDATSSHVSCTSPSGHVDTGDDCDDSTAAISPSADESCNGIDDDCDGATDESDAIDQSVFYADADADGYGDQNSPSISCTAATGTVADSSDCDDQAAAVNPDADEVCDTVDNDCDGTTDESDATDALVGHLDYDGDGFGGQSMSITACTLPSGYVVDSTDCDDGDPAIAPDQIETCDTTDHNCDGNTQDGACDATAGLTCQGTPSACASTCGDSILSSDETCDDGTTANGDGCSATCTVEFGFGCSGSPSVCTSTCGDSDVAADEACDDGVNGDGDGCTDGCLVEPFSECTGSPSVCSTDSSPDAFDFVDIDTAALDSDVTSSEVTLAGFAGTGTLSLAGDTSTAELIVDSVPTGGLSADVAAGDIVSILVHTDNTYGAVLAVDAELGDYTSVWTVTTLGNYQAGHVLCTSNTLDGCTTAYSASEPESECASGQAVHLNGTIFSGGSTNFHCCSQPNFCDNDDFSHCGLYHNNGGATGYCYWGNAPCTSVVEVSSITCL